MSRVKLLRQIDVNKADQEFDSMIADLQARNVKHHAIKSIMLDYENLKNPKGKCFSVHCKLHLFYPCFLHACKMILIVLLGLVFLVFKK